MGFQNFKKINYIDDNNLLTFGKVIIAFNMSYFKREYDLLQKFQPYHRSPVMGGHQRVVAFVSLA